MPWVQDGASTPHRTGHVSPSHNREKSRNAPHRSPSYEDDREEPAPSHLLPDVIDVDEEADVAEETRLGEVGSPDQPYGEPYVEPRIKRKTRKSIYKKGMIQHLKTQNTSLIQTHINGLSNRPMREQPHTRTLTHTHTHTPHAHAHIHPTRTHSHARTFSEANILHMTLEKLQC